MNIRTALTAATLAIGSLAATAPAFASGFDHATPPAAPAMAFGAARSATRAFVAQTEASIAQIAQQVRTDVSTGRVQRRALNVLNYQRGQLEATLRQASRDGVITRPEMYRVTSLMDALSGLDAQYRLPTHGRFPAGYGAHR